MATIKIEVVAGAQTYTKTKTLTAPQLVRMLAAYRVLLGKIQDPAVGDPPVLPPLRDMTDAETVDAWAAGLLSGTLANVRSVEQEVAKKTASDAVVPIVLT